MQALRKRVMRAIGLTKLAVDRLATLAFLVALLALVVWVIGPLPNFDTPLAQLTLNDLIKAGFSILALVVAIRVAGHIIAEWRRDAGQD